MNLYFDKGIDDTGSWLKVMKEHKIVKQSGSGIRYPEDDDVKFQSKDFEEMLQNNPRVVGTTL